MDKIEREMKLRYLESKVFCGSGVFVCTVLNAVLQELPYRDNYDTICQGKVWSSMRSSVSTDAISGHHSNDLFHHLYTHMDLVKIPCLGIVSNLAVINRCGLDTNVNTQTKLKKIAFNEDKCVSIHVGKGESVCGENYIDTWKANVRKINHIASMINLEDTKGEAGAIQKLSSSKYIRAVTLMNIQESCNRGTVAVDQICDMLPNMFLGCCHYEATAVLHPPLQQQSQGQPEHS